MEEGFGPGGTGLRFASLSVLLRSERDRLINLFILRTKTATLFKQLKSHQGKRNRTMQKQRVC